ncbi:hypothetical protein PM082_020451 [Marasmius tenuissimus]|nr:hypothetical protein PM082_020451 [Marasmius tenuissimus]
MSTPVFDPLDTPVSRHSNSTGAPLPSIPRRGSSSRTTVPKVATPTKPADSTVHITLQQATPPEDDKSSSDSTTRRRARTSGTSDSTLLSPQSKTRPFLKLMTPSSLPVTPTPTFRTPRSKKEEKHSFPTVIDSSSSSDEEAVKELAEDDTPRPPVYITPNPRPPVELAFQRTLSESHVYRPGLLSLSKASAPVTPVTPAPPIVRKKSGQPVKSSLKRSSFSGCISIGLSGISSKSEPTTPTIAKAVKFDSHLERVKLFIAEQKPLAVSRDGSPTDETDSDFPDFIFGREEKKSLTMKLMNMPPILNLAADVVLEEMKFLPELSSVTGRIRVRNLAFQKWVAVRFTFDDWQTTSEVTGKYVESASPIVDVFSFVIKLNDMLPRLEEKTMIVAIRYSVHGREIWDNNGGKNYIVTFSRQSKPQAEKKPTFTDDSRSGGGDIAVLRNRLEEVVQNQEAEEGLSTLKQLRRGPQRKPIPDFKNGQSFAARYDFGSSFKESWTPPESAVPLPSYATVRHVRMNSYPSQTPQKHIMRKNSPGSPRDARDDMFQPSPYVPSDYEEATSPLPVHTERATRHHQRGYFDLDFLGDTPHAVGLKRTPAGFMQPSPSEDTATSEALCIASPEYFMMSPTDTTPRSMADLTSDSRSHYLMPTFASPLTETTPALSSPSSSSTSSSPSADEFVSSLTAALTRDIEIERSNYHQFLSRFCFYTGTESGTSSSSDPNSPTDDLSRSSSSESVDVLLGQSPRLQGYAFGPHITPPATRSGSVTPTSVTSSGAEDSRSPTPVLA